MTRDIINRIQSVVRVVFVDNDLQIDRETTADDVPGWDSLSMFGCC
jgi:acyl carrier protein